MTLGFLSGSKNFCELFSVDKIESIVLPNVVQWVSLLFYLVACLSFCPACLVCLSVSLSAYVCVNFHVHFTLARCTLGFSICHRLTNALALAQDWHKTDSRAPLGIVASGASRGLSRFCSRRGQFAESFSDEKSNKLLMDLLTGGGVKSVLHLRIVVWAGNVQHYLVEMLLLYQNWARVRSCNHLLAR